MFLFHAMPDTNTSLCGMIGAPLVAAAFYLCSMPNANFSLHGPFDASFMVKMSYNIDPYLSPMHFIEAFCVFCE